MQLLILALALGIFLHDDMGPSDGPLLLPAPLLLAVAIVPKAAIATAYAAVCRAVHRRLGKRGGTQWLRRLDRLSESLRYLTLGLYGLDLYLGFLRLGRRTIGDVVLLDELFVMAPTLLLLLFVWWAYYPIDRRLREAALIGRVDAGLPIYPIWTRTQYILAQFRHQVALILLPLLAVMGWSEAAERIPGIPRDATPITIAAGAGVIFLLAPVALRYVWDTAPLPPGELRDTLTALCRRHRVGVRELLLWRTFGGLTNAAVMGLVAPLRYILLSDALLDMLRRDEVEAVMAHELAHVRRHHMFWLLIAAVVSLALVELGANVLLWTVSPPSAAPAGFAAAGPWPDWAASPMALFGLVVLLGAGAWVAIFGWVSRRVERQADAFAVQSLATARSEPRHDAQGRVLIDAESVHSMVSALGQVARLNHVSPARRSWRHGSIAWRQAYLRGLIGRPVDDLPIDRQMRWVKLGTLVAAAIAAAGYIWIPGQIVLL